MNRQNQRVLVDYLGTQATGTVRYSQRDEFRKTWVHSLILDKPIKLPWSIAPDGRTTVQVDEDEIIKVIGKENSTSATVEVRSDPDGTK